MSFASVSSRFRPVSTHRVSARTARSAGRPLAVFGTVFIASATMLTNSLRAQTPGTLDSTFLSAASETTIFTVNTANVAVASVTSTPVEEVLTGGDETTLEVLDTQGVITGQFTQPPFGGGSRRVYTIVADPYGTSDPMIPLFYLGGLFGKFTFDKVKQPAKNIIRINVDGTIDSAFDPGTGTDDYVTSILPLNDSDESTMVGGLFSTFNGAKYPHLVRLLRSGAVDPSFSAVEVDDGIFAMAPQIEPTLGTPNPLLPQFLIGGTFGNIGSTAYTKIARIDVGGNVDTSFRPVLDERVLAIATQPDGKIIIGGQFATINGQAVGHLARLNQDGSLDTTFSASISGVPDGTSAPVAVYTLNLLPDGRIYVGGNFSTVNGVKRLYLARINTDGSLDASFDPGSNITNSVQSIAVRTGDKGIYVGETVSKKINNIFPPSLVRLFSDSTDGFSSVSVEGTTNAREGTAITRQNGLVTFTPDRRQEEASFENLFLRDRLRSVGRNLPADRCGAGRGQYLPDRVSP